MLIAEQLHAAGVPVFPCRDNKHPAVSKGESWRDYAARPPSANHWPSALVGVPVPDGCVIIDLDTYKGVTRAGVESVLGCSLPWDAALIQVTQRGGQHYAFSVAWSVRQGSDIQIEGLDTRVAGKGYICTGAPYYQPQGFGVFALAHPQALPMLPDACRGVLEHIATEAPLVALPDGDKDLDSVLAALSYIDPGCARPGWVKVGMALRHYFHDAEDEGYTVFDQWSSGELWPDGAPTNYDPEAMVGQWSSFKAEGGVGVASLFYEAIRGGWAPPPTLDTSLAFGAGAAPVEQFTGVLSLIHESGTDSGAVPGIIDRIRSGGFNELQAGLLRGELKAALRSARLLDKNLTAEIDKQIGGAVSPGAGRYDKNHASNASLFVALHYPGDTLIRKDQLWYNYDGRSWVEKDDEAMRHELYMSMLSSNPQTGTVTGTYQSLCDFTFRPNIEMNPLDGHVILFQNGVLDLNTGAVMAHSQEYYTTKILPYDYAPTATPPHWLRFLGQTLEDDAERIALLQEWLGYMMSPTYQYQKIMLFLGPLRAGKSVIGEIMEHLVGPLNYTGTSLESLTEDDALDGMRGKTVAFSGETQGAISPQKIGAVIERLKKISGCDAIDFKRKYKSRLSCRLPTRITLSANQVPRLFDDSGALSYRMLILPFEVTFANREDPYLSQKLHAELEGIAVWALEGLRRLNAAGRFTEPAKSAAERIEIEGAYSPLTRFIREFCVVGGDAVTPVRDLYAAYRAWAVDEQLRSVMGRNTFVNAFKDTTRGTACRYGKHRTGDDIERGFRGLSLRPTQGGHASAFIPEIVS